ncbi:hypothetical protein H7J51_15890 [Mycobacterium crocinum]|uniref:Uncharacterized protein n=1 Tax=Mycolicibacterium crocinum TaxID=388459 RepID=A0ABY3TND5_9MYCO|nr:hypothetical protein [Mycolicibacterium crocinum]MCV7216764.1 hypothetical protein [Mycolicibacterium crocinum]ULN40670.1 hypothetical protein MI149_23985 [Mycolicibacterium crocinum]
MWMRAVASAALVGALVLSGGVAAAAPNPTPAPGAPNTSSSDEIADMVMDAIQQPAPLPSTPVPAPPAE